MIIVTRPSPYGEILTELCNHAGLSALHRPLFTIMPDEKLALLPTQLSQLTPNDIVIIVSPQVINALQQWKTVIHFPTDLHYFTVGKSTAELFTALTHCKVNYPILHEDSEGLIELIESNNIAIAKSRVLILSGNVGRMLLHNYFESHNATVIRYPCYQRSPINYATPFLADNTQHHIIVITSVEHLLQLEHYCQASDKLQHHLVVSHQRIAHQAQLLGWQHVTLSINANNQNLFKTIETLCHNTKIVR